MRTMKYNSSKSARRPLVVLILTVLLSGSIVLSDAAQSTHELRRNIVSGNSVRGGATKLSKKKFHSVATESSSQALSSKSQDHRLPKVQAILVPRRINILRLFQTASLGCLLLSLFSCLWTVGEPRVQSIWTELYAPALMPPDYTPSSYDILFTKHAMLPPPFLPNPKPLISLLLANVIYVVLGLLFPRWFASSYGVALVYRKVDNLETSMLKQLNADKLAALVHVPRETRVYTDNKASLVCHIHPLKPGKKNVPSFHFDLCCQRYYYYPNATVVSGAPAIQYESTSKIVSAKGHTTNRKLQKIKDDFDSYNKIQLPTPTILQAFLTRLESPLVVLQLFGKVLSALDDPSILDTLFSTGSTLMHHYFNARQSIVSARELSKEVHDQEASLVQVKVKRLNKWTNMNAVELLPGDIFELAHDNDLTMPVDAVILNGSTVTNEAVLTGETVAQSKVALEDDGEALDMLGRHRSSILFAGSTLLHTPQTLTCLALRTGSYSSRGDLLRALQRSRVGAVSNAQTERDGLRLMASLGVVACCSCTWFWTTTKEEISIFRKVLLCSRIILAAIPSDLPMALSDIAHTCAKQLKRQADVVCSEPGSLLTAANINHVIFDKTGTLTADTQSLSHIETLNSTDMTENVDRVLCGCHSLVKLQGEYVGDPLDLASLRHSKWQTEKDGRYTKDGSSLWQIKSFPFDASRRTSSSLVLVCDDQGELKLYKLVKGSPDTVIDLVTVDRALFDETASRLGRQGYRVIAMGIQDVTNDTDLVNQLFGDDLTNKKMSKKKIRATRVAAQKMLHRDSFEASESFGFCGFSCFEATVRPSTPRIVEELQQAQVGITMLTGDGIDAAVSVARRCRIIPQTKEVSVLDWEDSRLCFKHLNNWNNDTRKTPSTREVISSKKYCLVATGSVIQALTEKEYLTNEETLVKNKLHEFSVFARASPRQKVLVTSLLKSNQRKVLMCGDGVNDVAAMKVADCGVALLNGFGDQSSGSIDVEDERRRQRVMEKQIGSNRRIRKTANPGFGNSARANRARVRLLIEDALLDVKKRAAVRQCIADPNDSSLRLTMADMRESLAAILRINREERERSKLLRKGGAGAAKILAEDDKKIMDGTEGSSSEQDIKPGEASLVSPFSCLRPAIDGVEALLRHSVAAASFMHVMHQSIALNCLQSAFYLATLYKNGFRYGKYMWNVQFVLYIISEQASNHASCTPRPRLSTIRPPETSFGPFAILSIISQFFIHSSTRMAGVRLANRLEAAFVDGGDPQRLIKVSESSFKKGLTRRPMAEIIMDSLVKGPVVAPEDSEGPAILKLFRRAPFKPNYTANVVFLLSIFQPAVSLLVNHKGRPFHGAILENRHFIIGIGLSLLFALSMLAEGIKPVNRLLELRLLPTTRAQLCFFAIFAIDFLACWIAGTACRLGSGVPVFDTGRANEIGEGKSTTASVSAADQEEKLLEEEAEENSSLVRIMLSSTGMIMLSSLAKTLEQGSN